MTDAVHLVEVGPRDGLQNDKHRAATVTDPGLIGRLVQTGLEAIEVMSFVSPKWLPQMADPGAGVATMAQHLCEIGRKLVRAPHSRVTRSRLASRPAPSEAQGAQP